MQRDSLDQRHILHIQDHHLILVDQLRFAPPTRQQAQVLVQPPRRAQDGRRVPTLVEARFYQQQTSASESTVRRTVRASTRSTPGLAARASA